NVLNAFLYRAPALKTARQRLNGKVLRIVLKEFSTPLVLVFSEPTTLLVALRTIANLWRYEHQSRNAQQIADRASKLYDKMRLFV
ncbi:DNA recombination protein RmuC, partial [Enterobacter hormaechei]|uniref:DNA recombination protein RmuC n=1 Tax=Enterobacter hormaechei TaxID=158836 RepID=UPI0025A22AB8